jgi:hypothetical protein
MTACALAVGVVACLASAGPSQASWKLFLMPSGLDGGPPSGPVLRYDLTSPSASPTFDRTIDDPSLNFPDALAFSPAGELFVGNRHDQFHGSITRFLHPEGVPVANGVIASPLLAGPHYFAFRGDELFVPQFDGSNVVRIVVDPTTGVATFNGVITQGLCCGARGVAVAPNGDLFVSACCDGPGGSVRRYVFDASGHASVAQVIDDGSVHHAHAMTFSPWGELFVTNPLDDRVSRFTIDAAGNAHANGAITSPSIHDPIDLDFSPWGELFIANAGNPAGQPGVTRWTFDSDHKAISNGSFNTSRSITAIQFFPLPVEGGGGGLDVDAFNSDRSAGMGPLVSSEPLTNGTWYVVTVTGTYSAYPRRLMGGTLAGSRVCGTPVTTADGPTGQDAASIFARPEPVGTPCPTGPQGSWFATRTGDPASAPLLYRLPVGGIHTDPAHTYTYYLRGQGFPASFAIRDSNPTDNYGHLSVTVGTPTAADCTNDRWRNWGRWTSLAACLAGV